jgi:hypothetical protein
LAERSGIGASEGKSPECAVVAVTYRDRPRARDRPGAELAQQEADRLAEVNAF